METSCPIEKPQSSGRSVSSQNPPTCEMVQYVSHKRHCRASGLVLEPNLTDAANILKVSFRIKE
ncbi:MAG: hypothetical protein AAFZ99_16905, partial [Pseudomonadota bacterium]